jgi:hypothetical protein
MKEQGETINLKCKRFAVIKEVPEFLQLHSYKDECLRTYKPGVKLYGVFD